MSHVGYQSAIRLCSLHKCLDVARMRGTHLDHSNVVVFVQSEQRLGNTNIVVEVAFRRHHVVALRQDGTNQFLRRCLTIRASNAYHWNIELTTMLASQILICLQAVVDDDDALV